MPATRLDDDRFTLSDGTRARLRGLLLETLAALDETGTRAGVLVGATCPGGLCGWSCLADRWRDP